MELSWMVSRMYDKADKAGGTARTTPGRLRLLVLLLPLLLYTYSGLDSVFNNYRFYDIEKGGYCLVGLYQPPFKEFIIIAISLTLTIIIGLFYSVRFAGYITLFLSLQFAVLF